MARDRAPVRPQQRPQPQQQPQRRERKIDVHSCRAVLTIEDEVLRKGSHAGLILARYLQGHHKENAEKRELQKAAVAAVGNGADVYRVAFDRWKSGLPDLPGVTKTATCTVDGRLVIGLGSQNVLETGLTLHHTYGVPFIPGPPLKGLAAHYCDAVWGWGEGGGEPFRKDKELAPDKRNKTNEDKTGERAGETYRVLFGTTDDGGYLTFHDAWLVPSSGGLELDVMTPHHGGYNMPEDSKNPAPPTDFDDPIPVSFLSVKGKFLVAVSFVGESEDAEKWAELGLTLLTSALDEWGVGGKTNAGYGRLRRDGGAQRRPAGTGGKPDTGKPLNPEQELAKLLELNPVDYTGRNNRKQLQLIEDLERLLAGQPNERRKAVLNRIADKIKKDDREKELKVFLRQREEL